MDLVWGAWFVGFVLAPFGVFETYALMTGRPTLSQTVWRWQARFPIISLLTGMAIGGLAVHFFGLIPACR